MKRRRVRHSYDGLKELKECRNHERGIDIKYKIRVKVKERTHKENRKRVAKEGSQSE